MSPPYVANRSNTTGFIVGALVTLALHSGLVVAIIIGTLGAEKAMDEQIAPKMLKFEEVELLALGVEKPEKELPTIANPKKAETPPEKVVINQPNKPVISLKKKKDETKVDPNARKKKMAELLSELHNPNRPTNDEIPEGKEDGFLGGTAKKSMLRTYATELLKEFNKHWSPPSTLSVDEAQALAGTVNVYVRLSNTGSIVSYRFKKKSSNDQFNASIERVLKRYQATGGRHTLPLPKNPEILAAVVKEGLNLKKWKYTGR